MTEWTKERIAELRRACEAAGMDGDDELSARLEFDDYGRSQYVVENDDETIRVYPYEYRKHGETGRHREDYCLAKYVAPAMSKFPAALDEIERLQEQVDNLAGELAKMLVKKSEVQNERDEIAESALQQVQQRDALLSRIRQHAHRLPPDIEAELEEGG